MPAHEVVQPGAAGPEVVRKGACLRLISKTLQVRSTWLVACVAFLWLSATTGLYPLLLPDEGRYVGVAWNMLTAGQYSVPRLDGLPFFHKPPLFYWITALSLNVFGANEWAARLSSVLGATLMVTLVFAFLKAYANQRVAALAAIILLSQPLLFGASHYANLDMTVAGIITATVMAAAAAAFRLEQGERHQGMLGLAYALAAAGFLAKGLIGIVLPGGIIVFWLIARRRWDILRRLFWLPGLVIFLAVSLPWMVAMQQRYADFFDYYIVHQHVERFLEKNFNNARPFWFYVPVLLALTLPWSVQIWRLANKAWWKRDEDAAVRSLMLTWLVVVLVFFSVPNSKLVGYILPALAPLAYFLAESFARRLSGPRPDRVLKGFGWSLAISLAICVAAVAAMVIKPQPSTKGLALQLQPRYAAADKVVMLERFRYDLDFYLGVGKSAFVVSNWSDPELTRTDNWRRELYDAAKFEPEAGQRLLIEAEGLQDKLCSARVVGLWLIGTTESPDRYPYLKNRVADLQDGDLRAWYVPAGAPLSFCGETPSTGPK
jgi:4-amino-4-deoxy-L-arabinose transferase-like glycosyltransferase